MTRKDYMLIADAVRERVDAHRSNGACAVEVGAIDQFVSTLCEKLKRDNPLFSSSKFYQACVLN